MLHNKSDKKCQKEPLEETLMYTIIKIYEKVCSYCLEPVHFDKNWHCGESHFEAEMLVF